MASRSRLSFSAVACSLLCFAPAAHAGSTFWSAASGVLPNAIACPWTRQPATGAGPSIQGGALVISTITSSANEYYEQTGAQLAMPADSLVVEFQMQLLSGATSSGARGPANLVLEVAPYRGTAVHIGVGEVFYTSANLTRGASANVPTTDAVHLYRIVVAGTAVRVYQDGIRILTGSTFTDSSTGAFGGTARILWGEASSLAYGTSHWLTFTHNAAPGTACGLTAARAPTWGTLKMLYR